MLSANDFIRIKYKLQYYPDKIQNYLTLRGLDSITFQELCRIRAKYSVIVELSLNYNILIQNILVGKRAEFSTGLFTIAHRLAVPDIVGKAKQLWYTHEGSRWGKVIN